MSPLARCAPSPPLKCCPVWQLWPRTFALNVQLGGLCEARPASIESEHAIVNHMASACGGANFSNLEGIMRFSGKMHISQSGKMHISFSGKMH